jgi:hypothetical protein
MDSESNRVTSRQRGVRFATIFTNFVLSQLVCPIIGHKSSIGCPRSRSNRQVAMRLGHRAQPVSEGSLKAPRSREHGVLSPRAAGQLNANRQALARCPSANRRRGPAGEIVSHRIAEAREAVLIECAAVRQSRGGGKPGKAGYRIAA